MVVCGGCAAAGIPTTGCAGVSARVPSRPGCCGAVRCGPGRRASSAGPAQPVPVLSAGQRQEEAGGIRGGWRRFLRARAREPLMGGLCCCSGSDGVRGNSSRHPGTGDLLLRGPRQPGSFACWGWRRRRATYRCRRGCPTADHSRPCCCCRSSTGHSSVRGSSRGRGGSSATPYGCTCRYARRLFAAPRRSSPRGPCISAGVARPPGSGAGGRVGRGVGRGRRPAAAVAVVCPEHTRLKKAPTTRLEAA